MAEALVTPELVGNRLLAKYEILEMQNQEKERTFTVEKPASLNYREGDRVKHIKFGEGTVKSIKDGGKDYEVTVEFDTAGQKKMFASFAKLKKA